MSDKTLIVPIAAQVLVVFEEKKHAKLDLSSRFNSDAILGQYQQYDLDSLFNPSSKTFFDKGVHLHWKLPKILKHGIANDDHKNIAFPTVPNRWLVIRYQTNIENPKSIPTKSWIIESDVIKNEGDDNEGNGSNWVALESIYERDTHSQDNDMVEKRQFVLKTIGVVSPLTEKYSETSTDTLIDLTAVGSVNSYFSAIYDECKGIFGFHDTMDDAKEGDTFSYLITGWYSNPENDPLSKQTKLNPQLVAQIKGNWLGKETANQEATTVDKSLLTHSLYHVAWKSQEMGAPKADVNICVGQTSYECLGAYLREAHVNESFPADPKNKETYLNALFNLLIEDEKEEKSLQKLEAENHAKQFMAKRRGILWELKKIQKENGQETEDNTPFFPQEPQLVADLRTLNTHQVAYNQKKATLLSLQQEYYFYWYKIVAAQTESVGDDVYAKIDFFKATKEALKNKIEEVENDLKSLNGFIVGALKEIGQHKNIKIPKEVSPQNEIKAEALYELSPINEDLFWQPTEPAILMYGDGLGDVSKYAQDLGDTLNCRNSSQLIEKIYLVDKDIAVQSAEVFGLASETFIHDEDVKKVVDEALILDPTLAVFSAIKAEGRDSKKDSEIIKEWVERHILPAQGTAKKDIIEEFTNVMHTQAWTPVFLLWKVGFTPKGSDEEISCQGLSPLSDGLSKTLKDMELETNFGQIVSQNLSGFYKQLLAQTPCFQLPPIVYEMDGGNIRTELKIDEDELSILGNQTEVYAVAPNPNQAVFAPLGAGTMVIHALSLVDGFGQQKTVAHDLLTKEVVLSQSLGGSKKNSKDAIMLPNRMIQPSRLHFDWLNQKDEVLYQDTGKIDHPIMGWLVPNFLDRMVMIYDGNGHEIKSIKRINNQNIAEYYPANAETLDLEALRIKREGALDPIFKKIIDNLDIENFLDEADDLSARNKSIKTPASSSAVSILYGAPMAVAKGKIRIERLGNDTQNPNWHADKDDTGTIRDLAINLQIGQTQQNDDGLLGYFIGENYEHLYRKPSSNVLMEANQNEISITVILSSKTGFYIASDGLLPARFIKLFPHAVEELSKEIKISFMLAPFMSNKQQTHIPTPNTPEATWNWIHRASVTTWEQPNDVKKDNQQVAFDLKGNQFYEGWVKMNDLKATAIE